MGIFSNNVMSNYNLKDAKLAIQDFPRYDLKQMVAPQSRWLTPVTWALSYPDVWKHHTRITRDLQGIKPPYILLANHNSFFDFKALTAAIFPHRANYVVALDGFIGREWIMRAVGCICKRKFVNDLQLIRQMANLVKQGQIIVLYPEARYSHVGTQAVLPDSLGKSLKYMNVPVVTLITQGHHIDAPVWNQKSKGVPSSAELKKLFTCEELKSMSAQEINALISERFIYDDYAWQRDNHIVADAPDRAEGLHRVLYQCPYCKKEYRMMSQGSELFCEACGKHWQMDVYGQLHGQDGVTEFAHIPHWYEWQRENIRQEVIAGTYGMECEVLIDSLPNSAGFIPLGRGTLRHDMQGFVLRGEHLGTPFEVVKSVPSLYSIHVEFNYIDKKMDCIDISTHDDTYFCYPVIRDASVTKMAIATEELFQHWGARGESKSVDAALLSAVHTAGMERSDNGVLPDGVLSPN